MKKLFIFIIPVFALLGLLACFAFSQKLQVTRYTLSSEKLDRPAALAVVSDLHNSFFGDHQEELVEAIRTANPDAVLFIGDMAEDLQGLAGTRALVHALDGEFPIFYVSGNHECISGELEQIQAELRGMGVQVLEGESAYLSEDIRIAGAADPQCLYRQEWLDQIDALRASDDTFTILLSHRPDRIESYSEGFDLVLCGHAHGGQVRIPLLLKNGLWAPNQGWLPKLTAGVHAAGEGKMIVSRGLSKGFPPRIFNRPELVIVQLDPR